MQRRSACRCRSFAILHQWHSLFHSSSILHRPYLHRRGTATLTTPTFSSGSGFYSGTQTVTISTPTPGAKRLILFENLREDWHTHERMLSRQGLWVMAVYRFGRWRYTIRWRSLRMPFSLLYKVLKVISEILTGIDLPCEVSAWTAVPNRPFRRNHHQRRRGLWRRLHHSQRSNSGIEAYRSSRLANFWRPR